MPGWNRTLRSKDVLARALRKHKKVTIKQTDDSIYGGKSKYEALRHVLSPQKAVTAALVRTGYLEWI